VSSLGSFECFHLRDYTSILFYPKKNYAFSSKENVNLLCYKDKDEKNIFLIKAHFILYQY